MTLSISGRERTLALKFKDLPPDLRHTISVALVDGNHLLLDLCPQDLEALVHAAERAFHRTRNPKSQQAIKTLMRKIITTEGIPHIPEIGSFDSEKPSPAGPDDPDGRIIEKVRQATPGARSEFQRQHQPRLFNAAPRFLFSAPDDTGAHPCRTSPSTDPGTG